jgi:hypothetical protein
MIEIYAKLTLDLNTVPAASEAVRQVFGDNEPRINAVEVGPFETPPVGAALLCLCCAYYKPWGVFDSNTGASVCKDCKIKADASRWVLKRDNDSHSYMVPFELAGKFAGWVAYMEGETQEWKGPDFGRFRMNMHISGYVFEGNWREADAEPITNVPT